MGREEIEKQLPKDSIMEHFLLGAILAEHKKASEALDAINPGDFFDDRHRKIASTILELYAAGIKPNLLSVHDELTRSGDTEKAGGIAYIASLVDGVATAGDILYAVRGLRRMATFRQAVHLADNIKQLAFEQSGSPGSAAEGLIDFAIERFSRLARDIENTEDDGTPYFDSSIQALSVAREGARLKIYCDIEKLDQWTGGFREGELVVLTAETGTGKSLLAAQIRARACRDGLHALFCSGEMSAAHLASRELATASGVTPIKMRRDDLLSDEDYNALVTAASHQCKKCRILDGELNLSRIRRAARKMKGRDGLDLLILDYDELIEAEGKTEFDQQRVIARAAKSLAKELHCVVILVSQLRKTTTGENAGKPTLQRLYGNAAKQKFASYIILADRPYVRELEGDEKEAEIQLLKSRDGKTGRIKATFNIRSLRFEQAEEEYVEAKADRPVLIPRRNGSNIAFESSHH
ncbi:MAG TPA: replicative DNA helicase [Candidatus Dormibacteraeota bacterium]|nr:replicative DNA helicase [Candidatus Dormibacteraeota bacterium]